MIPFFFSNKCIIFNKLPLWSERLCVPIKCNNLKQLDWVSQGYKRGCNDTAQLVLCDHYFYPFRVRLHHQSRITKIENTVCKGFGSLERSDTLLEMRVSTIEVRCQRKISGVLSALTVALNFPFTFPKGLCSLGCSVNCCRDTDSQFSLLYICKTKLGASPWPCSEYTPFLFLVLCFIFATFPSHRMTSTFICSLVFMRAFH